MNKEVYLKIWNDLEKWYFNTLKLAELGIETSKHDKELYDLIILVMSLHFNSEQVDFFKWSIFDENRLLPVGEEQINITNAEISWEYINKLK